MIRLYFLIFVIPAISSQSTIGSAVLNVSPKQVDTMLRNPVVVQRQIKCLKCMEPCDRIGQELKRVIPQIARTQCRNCSPTERANMGKIINHVQTYYPKDWSELNVAMRHGRRC